jgi:hypothetical protein
MMRPLPKLLIACILTFARSAAASTPDARDAENRLDEQLQDGDRDLEDIASARLSPHAVGGVRMPSAYVALEGFAGTTSYGRQYGGFVVLQLPFECVGRRPIAAVARAVPDAPQEELTVALSPAIAPFGSAPSPSALYLGADAGPAPSTNRGGFVVLDLAVARACVTAALRAVGLADDARLESIASRARSSGMLPELRLRAMRSVDESGRITLSEIDPSRYTETGGATDWLEARLTFRLDRLLFADDEVSVERIRIERADQRARATTKVIEALFEWQRAYILARDPDLGTDEHVAALLRELEAASRLDIMTEGWFGRFRAGLKGPPS